jgi:hypothetical protein
MTKMTYVVALDVAIASVSDEAVRRSFPLSRLRLLRSLVSSVSRPLRRKRMWALRSPFSMDSVMVSILSRIL